ncbi:MAG: MFS transporter, partial [Spirochaetales bacterium]|nr:MFS transporter [Spirochaetales bacterium]
MHSWKKNLYLVWIAQILSLAGFGFMLPFLPFFLQEVGVTDPSELKRWVGLVSAVPALTLGLMAPVWGYLADRVGRKLMILRSMAAGCAVLIGISFVQSPEGILAMRIVQGLITGTITASAAMVAGGTPRAKLSYALGFLASSTFIGLAFGPLLGGITAEFLGYRTASRMGGALLAIGFFVVLLFVKEIRQEDDTGRKKTQNQVSRRNYLFPMALLLLSLVLIRFSRSLPFAFLPLFVQDTRGSIEGASIVTGLLTSLAGIAAAVSGITIARLGDRMNKLVLVSICLAAAALVSIPL